MTTSTRLSQLLAVVRGHPLFQPCAILVASALAYLIAPDTLAGASMLLIGQVGTGLKECRQAASDIDRKLAANAERSVEIDQQLIAISDAVTTPSPARGMTDDEKIKIVSLKEQRAAVNESRALLLSAKASNGERLTEAEARNEAERNAPAPAADGETTASRTAASRIEVIQPKEPPFGVFLQHVRNAATPGGVVHDSLRPVAAITGLNETVPSEGGFLVQQERATTIAERVYEVGELLKRVNRIPIGANSNGMLIPAVNETSRADGSRYGGIRSYWTAEGGEKLASKPSFRLLDLKLKKLAALVYATDELLQDSVALEAWIMSHLPDELVFKTEDAIVSGTGAGQPLGFLNSGAALSVTRNTAGAIKYEDIVAMWSRLYAPSRKNAIWLIDQGAEAQLFSMSLAVGVGGVPVYMPAGGIAASPHSTLFGRPIVASEYGAALGTVGDVMLVDPSQYTLIDKGGVQSAVSMHVRFIYDESVFRFVYRVDGAPEWNSALTPKSGGATTSPYVLLAT